MTRSTLDEIKGIGTKTKEILLKHFGSVEKILQADEENLKKLIGVKKTSILTEFLKN
jgi:excinuclease ABC subunit C